MMKNSVKEEWIELFSDSQKLYRHIENILQSREQKSFIYKQSISRPAAVLIPLFFKNRQAHLLFTKRTSKVATHKGQISFPGGSKDDTDPDLKFTALRETEEEVGIFSYDIKVLGMTDIFLTNTDFLVTPFAGWFNYPYDFNINKDEIERLIEVPLAHLLQEEVFSIRPVERDGVKWNVHYYNFNGDIIWGVTGFLLSNFLSIVFGLNRSLAERVSE
jgi:8-oxo-dGTP pyrophosphatase MutT (NUDIX family)